MPFSGNDEPRPFAAAGTAGKVPFPACRFVKDAVFPEGFLQAAAVAADGPSGRFFSHLATFSGVASTFCGVKTWLMNRLRIFMPLIAPGLFGGVQRLVPLGHAGGFRLQHGGRGVLVQNADVLDLVSPDDGVDDGLAFQHLPENRMAAVQMRRGNVVMKNWEPLVPGPAFAMESTPGPSCLRSGENSSSKL